MPPVTPSAQMLRDRLHAHYDAHDNTSRTRLHRAISWLRRAERETADPDGAFVSLWIAFNAAYAQEFERGDSTRDQVNVFFGKLVALDADGTIHNLLFHHFSGPIRTLIDNKFAFAPFWKAVREHDASEVWKEEFDAAKRTAMRAVLEGGTGFVLDMVFDRLYVLRNQLIHGGATWQSRVNRGQVHDGVAILSALVPVFIALMLAHPETDFGDVMYPVV